jgi:hypothetical protein
MKAHLFKLIWLTLFMALTMMILVPCSVNAAASSNISQARYVATIRITNNGTTAAYNASIPLTLNTSYLVNNGYMDSNLSNTAMRDNFGNDTYYNPAVVANHTWIIFVPVIPADSSIDYALYMGGGLDMAGNLSWMPGVNGGTTPNSGLPVLGNNFSITQIGYLDTDYYKGKNSTAKAGSIVTNITAAGNLTATFYGIGSLTSSGINSGVHNITVFYNGSAVGIKVDFNPIVQYVSDVNLDGVVNATDEALVSHYYLLPSSPGDPDYLQYLRCDVDLSGNVTIGDIGKVSNNYTRLKYDLNGDGLVDQSDISALQDYILFGTPESYLIAADYNNSGTITIADVTLLTLQSYQTLATTSSLNNTTANWQFAGNNTWTALERQTIVINGTTVQDISWQNAAIWSDSSGNNNDLTPTFRTTTTNANVSASLIDIRAFNQAALTSWNLNDYSNNLGIPDMPGGMYEGVNPTFPGSGIPGDIEASTGGAVPQNMFWFIIPCLVVVGIGMMVHDKIKSLFAQFIIILVLVLFISLTHIWSFWVLVPIILIGGSSTLAGKIFNY